LEISDNGYFQVEVANTELYSQTFDTSVKDMCDSWDKQPMLVMLKGGNWHVHLQIFSKGLDGDNNVEMWRRVALEEMGMGVFARMGYLIIPSSVTIDPSEIHQVVRMSTSENIPIFGRDRERNNLFIHISVLSDMSRLEGIVEEKSNMMKMVLEKNLFKNMTEYATVMLFDRETVYSKSKYP